MTDQARALQIAETVAEAFGLTLPILLGRRRELEICDARAVAMRLIREATGLTLKQVASMFAGRHYTTVIYIERRARDLEETEDKFRRWLAHCRQTSAVTT